MNEDQLRRLITELKQRLTPLDPQSHEADEVRIDLMNAEQFLQAALAARRRDLDEVTL